VDITQTRARLTTPADTLLQVAGRAESKPSIGLNTTVESALGRDFSGALTAGFDRWTFTVSGWATLGALATTGSIPLAPGQPAFLDRVVTDNTGYFTQGQLGFRDVLFVTAGLRAERNNQFGDDLGTAFLPRVGVSFVQSLHWATLKLRGSWGRAIKPPSPGAKVGFTSAFGDQLPNPDIGPERQQGWDAGVDATFGSRGSLSVTYYDQSADNLIDAVVLQVTPVRVQRFENVGRVKNTGIEIEGALAVGPLTLQGQYGYIRARVERLSPTYAGDLMLGDQPRMRPRHTAGVSLAMSPTATTTLSAGLAYVGSWRNTDVVAQFRCLGQTGPCRPTPRDYLMTYPALTKINATVVQQLTPALAGFVSVDNLTNNSDFEITNLTPVWGRSSTIGLRLQH
jgi:outer membrane receptor protein involved in Fe transport